MYNANMHVRFTPESDTRHNEIRSQHFSHAFVPVDKAPIRKNRTRSNRPLSA
jgi:hypothetical protein